MELSSAFTVPPRSDDNLNAQIRRMLIEVILDAARNSERSLQATIGPSEIGIDCERRLAMSLMNEPSINHGDPWPSIVGTAGHAWLENAFKRRNDKLGWNRFVTEGTVPVTGSISGHVDLYDILLGAGLVLDYKFVGVEPMRKYRKNGPHNQYRVQAHTYGKGYKQLGLPVKHVAIAFFSRGGFLLPEKTGLYVWSEPFDESIADRALARIDVITQVAVDLDVEHHPERYKLIPKTVDQQACNYCPWFKPQKTDDGLTCPGYMAE